MNISRLLSSVQLFPEKPLLILHRRYAERLFEEAREIRGGEKAHGGGDILHLHRAAGNQPLCLLQPPFRDVVRQVYAGLRAEKILLLQLLQLYF